MDRPLPSLSPSLRLARTHTPPAQVLATAGGSYRDGPLGEGPGDSLDVPVDYWWWLTFFALGKRCGKLPGEPLFGWRQHPRQHTRTHGRLAIESLRSVKAFYFAQGPAQGAAQVQVWSTGTTLAGWVNELRAIGAMDIIPVEWKPGAPLPEVWRLRSKRKLEDAGDSERSDVVRLFAYGKEKARAKVRASVCDWDDRLDWFGA